MKETIRDENGLLPIGTKHGCLTVIAGFEAYQQEDKVIEMIARLEEEKQKFIRGEESSYHNFTRVETFDEWINDIKNASLYKTQCKCGKIHFLSEKVIFRKKWPDCGDDCGLKLQREAKMIASYPRIEHPSCNIEFVNNTHESLHIIECIDDHVEGTPIVYDKRKKGAGRVDLYKKLHCKCYLCGKEYDFLSNDFIIRNDSYGQRATWGYYCNAYCDRHKISSFQWRTIAIFKEHKIAYRVEESFPDLLSEKGNPLRFDFAILNPDGTIKCLIECQGEQHYKVGNNYGGYAALEERQARDAQKRKYANDHHIPLIEIHYACNTYEKELDYLKSVGII